MPSHGRISLADQGKLNIRSMIGSKLKMQET